MKKFLKITGYSLLGLLLIAFLVPYLFKNKIVAFVKKEINNTVMAKVDFSEVDISLFRNFPKLSVRLENIYVAGVQDFEGDTLLSAASIDASVNLFSLFNTDDMKVYGLHLNEPRIIALVHKDGKANWDIAKEDTASSGDTETSGTAFKMNIRNYTINDGYILYNDESSNIKFELVNLDHEGSGDLSSEIFTLSTTTKAESVNFIYEGIPYLAGIKTSIGSDISINNTNGKYEFKTDDILLNDLRLSAQGFFQLVNDSTYNMDISFKSPSNAFRDILSLVPSIYAKDFDKLKTSGTAAFNGFVKGSYDPQHMPAYLVNLDVKDGFFQYPDLPKPVKNIQVSMKMENPDGIGDNLVIDIPRAHFEMDNEPFDFRLLFKNPETLQYLDAAAKGRIDLSNISQFVKLENGMKLSGVVMADAFAKGNLAALQQQQGDFSAGGFLDISQLFFTSNDFPQPIQNGNMKIMIENNGGMADNTIVSIPSAHIELGKDPFDFSLQLKKLVTTMDFAGKVKGKFTLDHIKQFTKLEVGTGISGLLAADLEFSGNKTAIDQSQYDKLKFSGSVNVNNLKYVSNDYPGGVNVRTTELSFTPAHVRLNKMEADVKGTHLSATGILNNLVGYIMEDQTLIGNLNLEANTINLNDWMVSDTTASSSGNTSMQVFQVPAHINFTLEAKADQVHYDKVNYKNVKGTVVLKDETVQLENVYTEVLDGTIGISGTYSTMQNKQQPDIAMAYDIKNVDVQKAFLAFNTVQKLMPAGQYISGRFSSQLSMTGKLGSDMMPELNTLTGNGNMLLLEGAFKQFLPLEKLANTLQVEELKGISLKDIKNQIEFTNGKVLVKPFNLKVKDIEMEIGGMHGFDQSLDYIIQMKLPRKYLGTKGNSLLNNLASKANSKGVPVQLGETVNLHIKMGGSITNPSIQTDLKETAGDATKELKEQAADFAKEKMDSTKQALKDTANNFKKQVIEDVKDDLKNKLLGKDTAASKKNTVEETKKKAEQTIKDIFKKKKG